MTKFISLEDFEGSSVSVDEKTIERANLYVERILAKLGVSSSLFPELKDNPHLKELARVYALYVTVIEYYTGDGNEVFSSPIRILKPSFSYCEIEELKPFFCKHLLATFT